PASGAATAIAARRGRSPPADARNFAMAPAGPSHSAQRILRQYDGGSPGACNAQRRFVPPRSTSRRITLATLSVDRHAASAATRRAAIVVTLPRRRRRQVTGIAMSESLRVLLIAEDPEQIRRVGRGLKRDASGGVAL